MKNVDCFIILTLSKIASPFLNVRQKWTLGIQFLFFWFLTFLQYFLIFVVLNNLSKPNLLIFIQYQVGQFQMPLQFSKIINSSKRFLPVSNFALLSKIASVQFCLTLLYPPKALAENFSVFSLTLIAYNYLLTSSRDSIFYNHFLLIFKIDMVYRNQT